MQQSWNNQNKEINEIKIENIKQNQTTKTKLRYFSIEKLNFGKKQREIATKNTKQNNKLKQMLCVVMFHKRDL
jgi:hypothetical protein